MLSRVLRDANPRKIALARASNICNRQIRPFAREGAAHKNKTIIVKQ
jgi:hypothetical protein